MAGARELLDRPAAEEREVGIDPTSGLKVVAKAGRYGPYVTEVLPEEAPKSAKPRTGSLFASMSVEDVSLEDALRLLSLPRVVGAGADGEEITAQNGRYGPYLKKGTDSRSLTSEDQIFDDHPGGGRGDLRPAEDPGRGAAGAAAGPLKELGVDPASGKPVVVKDGRFGPYVTDGETNATLRRSDAVDTVTLDRAAELLAEKRAKGPAPKRATRRATTRKPAARGK